MSSICVQSLLLLVNDTDEAIAYFVDKLGFALLANETRPDGGRWVQVGSAHKQGAKLILKQAKNGAQQALVGQQAAGGVLGIFEVSDFDSTYQAWLAQGVTFLEEPRYESYGSVAIFSDLYGNKWDLIGPPRSA
ncbi:VOC family protein [Salinimonas lutimaris]|uniref:VOC family protein n=1 Tax=Salinimonas lutimaris TaxID=914153 RepID=UPI0010BFA8AD|nr:VOC family protein [Salinimonas lutimaris]